MYVFIIIAVICMILYFLISGTDGSQQSIQQKSHKLEAKKRADRRFIEYLLHQMNEDLETAFEDYVDNPYCAINEIVPNTLAKSRKKLFGRAEMFSENLNMPISQVKELIEMSYQKTLEHRNN